MDAKRRVVLFGDTLVLEAVGRALSARQSLRVISLDPSQATALGDLDSLRPCAVVLDLSVVTPEAAIALVRGRPDLLLIGLDPGGESLLVLCGQQAHALSTEDLVWLIEARAAAPDSAERHGFSSLEQLFTFLEVETNHLAVEQGQERGPSGARQRVPGTGESSAQGE